MTQPYPLRHTADTEHAKASAAKASFKQASRKLGGMDANRSLAVLGNVRGSQEISSIGNIFLLARCGTPYGVMLGAEFRWIRRGIAGP
jgi:hypothetical protein